MSNISKWKFKLVQIFFVLFALVILASLYRWQVVEHDKYSAYAQQRFNTETLSSIRGPILASDSSPLAYSIPAYDVFIYTPEVLLAEKNGKQTRDELINALASTLKLDKKDVEKSVDSPGSYLLIERLVNPDLKKELENKQSENGTALEGIHFENREKRVYPDKELASNITGFVGKDNEGNDIGRNGVEGYWEGDLAWKEGFLFEERDSFGNQIISGELSPVRPKIGRTIKLTINRGVQEVLEDNLKKMMTDWKAKKAVGIIMDPRTGAIIAMADYPTYDPNEYWKVEDQSVFNSFGVSSPYEFGSIGKSFTAAAAMDLGIFKPDDILMQSHSGCERVEQGELYWDICTSSKKPHGPLSVTDTLKESDNLGAFAMSREIGPEKMHDYLSKFGFGYMTNVGMSEENTSYLKEWERWNKADIATYSFGQGYSGTALQITSAMSAIANEGVRMQPYLVSELSDDSSKLTIKPRVAEYVLSEKGARLTTDMLVQVYDVWNQSQYFPGINKYRIAAKSGTAQVVDETGINYASDKVTNTIVGYDASPNPKFVMLMTLYEQQGREFANYNVLPYWTRTFMEIKDLIGVEPYSVE